MPYKEMDAFSARNQAISEEIAELMVNGRRRILTRGQEMGQEVTMGQEVVPEVTTGNRFPVTTVGKRDTFYRDCRGERRNPGGRGREGGQTAEMEKFKAEVMEILKKGIPETGFQ